MKFIGLLIFSASLFFGNTTAQNQIPNDLYENTFQEISSMIDGEQDINFKRAVFIVENAFYDGVMDYNAFDSKIRSLAGLAYSLRDQIDLDYTEKDSAHVLTHASVWSIMTDTLTFDLGNGVSIVSKPYLYDFDDVFGRDDWSQMFVSKLLNTRKGNCHSLPYLYKILAEELGEEAYLSLAPNHIYIKQYTKKTGWFNTELTSASFPIDAWLTASGYIHLDTIRNGVYMDTLSQKESLALTLIDLAKGYERKFGVLDGKFILKAVDKALDVDPNFINALLLKAETQKKLFENEMLLRSMDNPNDLIEQSEEYRNLFLEMQSIYVKIHQLGYRQMPEEMYLDWLTTLQEERDKYLNKSIPVD